LIADVRNRHPDVVVHLRQSSAGSAGNLNAVLDGSMDIAPTASTANPLTGQSPHGVTVHSLVSEPLVFVCRPDHPLGRQAQVTVADSARQDQPQSDAVA
jgi:DNA-binding transcriptional LysR family regulator